MLEPIYPETWGCRNIMCASKHSHYSVNCKAVVHKHQGRPTPQDLACGLGRITHHTPTPQIHDCSECTKATFGKLQTTTNFIWKTLACDPLQNFQEPSAPSIPYSPRTISWWAYDIDPWCGWLQSFHSDLINNRSNSIGLHVNISKLLSIIQPEKVGVEWSII